MMDVFGRKNTKLELCEQLRRHKKTRRLQQTVASVEDQQAVADIIGKDLVSFNINELRCTEFVVINVLFATGSRVAFVSKTNLPIY